ncbi:hypothetical protein J1614_012254 [Plenodomus biglobosus]|nr:hypothetical protein J1614_012254 [Plenodomus biglobosus]
MRVVDIFTAIVSLESLDDRLGFVNSLGRATELGIGISDEVQNGLLSFRLPLEQARLAMLILMCRGPVASWISRYDEKLADAVASAAGTDLDNA